MWQHYSRRHEVRNSPAEVVARPEEKLPGTVSNGSRQLFFSLTLFLLAGRVNRARRRNKGCVIVHSYEDGSEKVYSEPAGILESSWKLCQESQRDLTEDNLIRLVEAAYAGRALSRQEAFSAIQAQTQAVQQRLFGVLDNPQPEEDSHLTTRLEKYHQVSIIREPLADEAARCSQWERRLFELKMPIWYVRENKSKHSSEDLPLCKMGYDSVLGAQFLSTSREKDPARCLI